MTAPNVTRVLVVGAGPVGLVAAVTLRGLGIEVRIIDEQTADGKRTYPVVLHPRTLRILRSLGVTAPLEWRGRTISRLAVYSDGQRRAVLGLPTAAEAAAGAMTLPQDVLRQALAQWLLDLGVRVEWQTRLATLEQAPRRVRAALVQRQRVEGGLPERKAEWVDVGWESVDCDYLVGADGVRSTVRHQLGIGWLPIGKRQIFAFYDAPDERAGDEAHLVIGEGFGSSVYPLQNDSSRFTFELGVDPGHPPGGAQLQQLLAARMPWYGASAERFEWSGSASFAPALAERFGEGRVWLAGDAGHCASPLGGQSVNVGIAEAYDLGRRIADDHDRGRALIVDYCEQRRWQWQQLFGMRPGGVDTSRAEDWVKRNIEALLPGLPASGDDLDELLDQLRARTT